jgi:hypothetical protein
MLNWLNNLSVKIKNLMRYHSDRNEESIKALLLMHIEIIHPDSACRDSE